MGTNKPTTSLQLFQNSTELSLLVEAVSQGNTEGFVEAVSTELTRHGDYERHIAESPLFRILQSRFPKELSVLHEQISNLEKTRDLLGDEIVDTKISELTADFTSSKATEISQLVSVAIMPEIAAETFMNAFAVLPSFIATDPANPTIEEVENSIELRRLLYFQLIERTREAFVRLDNLIILNALKSFRNTQIPDHPSDSDTWDSIGKHYRSRRGAYWIDKATGHIRFKGDDTINSMIKKKIEDRLGEDFEVEFTIIGKSTYTSPETFSIKLTPLANKTV